MVAIGPGRLCLVKIYVYKNKKKTPTSFLYEVASNMTINAVCNDEIELIPSESVVVDTCLSYFLRYICFDMHFLSLSAFYLDYSDYIPHAFWPLNPLLRGMG